MSDETLTAYLDGELSAQDSAAVEKAIEVDAGLADRLARLDVSVGDLRDSADALLAHAPAPPSALTAGARPIWPLAAGLVAACAFGFVFGLNWTTPEKPGWVPAVANYQSLYVAETLARSETDEERVTTMETLSEAIDLDLSPLLDIPNIEYRRAQMLGFGGRELVQVAYLDSGVPIAICIISTTGENKPVEQGEYFGLAAASWQKNGHGFLVIGGQDSALIRRIADEVSDSI